MADAFNKCAKAKEQRILLCYRIADTDAPTSHSRVSKCDRCQAAIWVADSSPKVDERVCMRCIGSLGDKITIERPTKKQLDELKRNFDK